MSNGNGTVNTIVNIFVGWGVIFFGVWVLPIDINAKIFVDVMNTFLFIFLAITYFDYKGKIPIGKETRLQIRFWFSIIIEIVQAITAFIMTIATWEVVTINDVQVITYENIVSLIFSIMGIAVILFVIHMIMNKSKYIERWSKEKVKMP